MRLNLKQIAFATAGALVFGANYSATQAACIPGKEEACPVLIEMKPGASTIEVVGWVSGEQPDYYFKFFAKAGQAMLINTAGGGLKTGPGIPIAGPNGVHNAIFEGVPYTLPATGTYVIDLHANTMSEGPFGQFKMTLRIEPISTTAQGLPTREGTCAHTKIAQITERLQSGDNGPPVPGSGSAVSFANGGLQVSYDELKAIQSSRNGDPVLICLISIPQHCPPGDARGRMYTTTNLRTMESWTLPDSEHQCGGA